MKCLLLEDDIELNETICQVLMLDQYVTDSCFDGETALLKIDQSDYDIYIFDINVPDMNGLELLKYIKQKSISSKVLIISSNIDIKTIEAAYKLGCYDYLKKPFYIDELRFKLNNIKKEFFSSIKFEDNTFFDFSRQELIKNGSCVKLTKKELMLLNLLIKNKDYIVSKDDIIEFVFDNQITNDVNIRALMKRLREKISKDIIQTISGVGYKFNLK